MKQRIELSQRRKDLLTQFLTRINQLRQEMSIIESTVDVILRDAIEEGGGENAAEWKLLPDLSAVERVQQDQDG